MKRKQKRNKSFLLRIFLLIVCGYFAVSLGDLVSVLNEKVQERDIKKAELSAELNEVAELRAMLESKDDTPIIEKAARDRLGYVYSDEQIFIDVSGN